MSSSFGLDHHPDVFFHPTYVSFDESALADRVEFVWRGYDDYSTSLTLYKAASLGLPVLALRSGFVGEAVEVYRLGATVAIDFSDLEKALELIRTWDPENRRRFLKTHSWEIGGRMLARAAGIV